MSLKTHLLAGLSVAGLLTASSASAELVGSFLINGSTLPADVDNEQFIDGFNTRTSDGNVNTRGVVAGDIGILGGTVIGTSGYDGVSLSSFSVNAQYKDLTRFGGGDSGLVTFDYDLSGFLSGVTAGNAAGESQFSIYADYLNRRAETGLTGDFYLSYNDVESGLALDTDGVADIAPGDVDAQVAVTTEYTIAGSLIDGTNNGTISFDITSHIAASDDGLIRVAYIDNGFRGGITFQNNSGINRTVVVPEPGSMLLVGAGGLMWAARRRRA